MLLLQSSFNEHTKGHSLLSVRSILLRGRSPHTIFSLLSPLPSLLSSLSIYLCFTLTLSPSLLSIPLRVCSIHTPIPFLPYPVSPSISLSSPPIFPCFSLLSLNFLSFSLFLSINYNIQALLPTHSLSIYFF